MSFSKTTVARQQNETEYCQEVHLLLPYHQHLPLMLWVNVVIQEIEETLLLEFKIFLILFFSFFFSHTLKGIIKNNCAYDQIKDNVLLA